MRVSYIMPTLILEKESELLLGLTRSAVQSFRKATPKAELVIIDDASPMGGGYLRSVADIYIRNKKQLSYPGALNRGLKLASGDLLAIVNNDIRVSPNWLAVVQDILTSDTNIGSVHFKMIEYDVPIVLGHQTWETGKERWCTSSFYVMKRELLDEVGLYDEKFAGFGYDDWDWWYRVRKKGYLTAYTNKTAYQHRDSSTYNLFDQTERQKHVEINRKYFKEKWGETPEDLWTKMYPEQMKVEPYREGFV